MTHGEWKKDYNHAERLLWQNAAEVLTAVGLKVGDTFIDLGAGDGYFSLPAARIAARVYAIDMSTDAIAGLKAKAGAAGLDNITASVADAEQEVLCPHCADIVLMANVLHDFVHPQNVLYNARQMLKDGGVLANLDWKKEPRQQHGPPLAKRLSVEEAAAIMAEAGFKVVRFSLSGPFHYLQIAATGTFLPA